MVEATIGLPNSMATAAGLRASSTISPSHHVPLVSSNPVPSQNDSRSPLSSDPIVPIVPFVKNRVPSDSQSNQKEYENREVSRSPPSGRMKLMDSSTQSDTQNQPILPNSTSPKILQQQRGFDDELNTSSEFPPLAATTTPAKKSYANIIIGAKTSVKSLEKMPITFAEIDGAQVATIPTSMFRTTPLWEDLLVGKFPPGQAPHVAKVHVIVNKIWAQGNKGIRIDAYPVNDSTIKFRIKDVATRNRVLRRGLWTIADIPMYLYKWTPNVADLQPTMRAIPLWITLQNIPPSLFSWEGISLIASSIGIPKKLHQETEMCVRFEEAKVLIEVDLMKPLPQSFLVQDHDGSIKKINFAYPKLPLHCSRCQKWGHSISDCLTSVPTSSSEAQQPSSPTTYPLHLPSKQVFSEAILNVVSGKNGNDSIVGEATSSLEVSFPNETTYKETHMMQASNDATIVNQEGRNLELVSKTLKSTEDHAAEELLLNQKAMSHIMQVLDKSNTKSKAETSKVVEGDKSDEKWKNVSPKKKALSPVVIHKNKIVVSSSFDALLDMEHEEEDNQGQNLLANDSKDKTESTTDATLVNNVSIIQGSSPLKQLDNGQDKVSDSSLVTLRPSSTRNRKPPLKFQQQNQPPSIPKGAQSKRSTTTRR